MMSVRRFDIVVHIILIFVSVAGADFVIDYENNTFRLDGEAFRYVSGSIHYFRVPNEYWRDRLRKIRACGLNAVSTYVEWSRHEPAPGRYDFGGDNDVVRFIETARDEGLHVILRPGPYICAERDFGGFPHWLFNKYPDMRLRTADPRYVDEVEKWMAVLMPKIAPLLHGNGGPILMVQVENEYGSRHTYDDKHNDWLRDLFRGYVGDKAVLFTTDGPDFLSYGKIPGVYATVDFGPEFDVNKAFSMQRFFEPWGPLVNSEYYPGWLTHWGERMQYKNATSVVKTLRTMLKLGANVNFYMFYGGSNFGFAAGANYFEKYQSDITSYDYDAPITEAGDLTDKYHAIKNALAEFLPETNITVCNSAKGDYGQHTLKAVASLLSPRMRRSLGVVHSSAYPMTFESLNQNYGYVLYETDIRRNLTGTVDFVVKQFNDYANVYVDGAFACTLSREFKENAFTANGTRSNQILGILVENLGRINYGPLISEMKGIVSNVTMRGRIMHGWNMTAFDLESIEPVEKCADASRDDACHDGRGFVFYHAYFTVAENASHTDDGHLLDSFLDVSRLTKGLVFVNGFNLGRYWSTRGPQYTLYVPGVRLKPHPERNSLVVMDESITDESITLAFRTAPIFEY